MSNNQKLTDQIAKAIKTDYLQIIINGNNYPQLYTLKELAKKHNVTLNDLIAVIDR